MLKPKTRTQLARIVGKEYLHTDPEHLVCYSYDATNRKFLPDAVIFPADAEQVSAVMKLANKDQFPVLPRGAGSGFTGGALAVRGGVVLVTTRLNRIIEIDADNLTAVVEPGVICGEFQKTVEKQGLYYPPDPSSLDFSTIGGNVAECAGGPRALKYGVTRDYVTGLEVVLPTGEILTTGVRTMKGVVGYDITRLIVGSEGTLAIITKVFLRLIPKPEATLTLLSAFDSIEASSQSVAAIIRNRVVPSKLELIDKASLECVEKYRPMDLPAGTAAVLLIELDGETATIDGQAAKVETICQQQKAIRVDRARSPLEAEALWKIRQAISPALMQLNLVKINEDIVVPPTKIPELVHSLESLKKEYRLTIISFGHAGDGNMHVNVMYDAAVEGEKEKAEQAVRAMFEKVIALGGTLSGEHGVGITKAPYVRMELSEDQIVLMKKIKRAFDPNDILNPGKMFWNA